MYEWLVHEIQFIPVEFMNVPKESTQAWPAKSTMSTFSSSQQ